MKIFVKYPMVARVDNIGAIFMARNIMNTSCNKHVDIRYKYVNEYVEEVSLLLMFSTFSTKI